MNAIHYWRLRLRVCSGILTAKRQRTDGVSFMLAVQEDLAQWHPRKYPDATDADVGVKLGEECGEVLQALDRIRYARVSADMQTLHKNLRDEIGDALIVLTVLCNRHGLDVQGVLMDRAEVVMKR